MDKKYLCVKEGQEVIIYGAGLKGEMFYEIAQETANQAGVNLNGFYWMGVIHLVEQ